MYIYYINKSHFVVQAISYNFPIAEVWVQFQVSSYGIYCGQVAIGCVLFTYTSQSTKVIGLLVFFPLGLHQTSNIINTQGVSEKFRILSEIVKRNGEF